MASFSYIRPSTLPSSFQDVVFCIILSLSSKGEESQTDAQLIRRMALDY
jgi:hypothetical protein